MTAGDLGHRIAEVGKAGDDGQALDSERPVLHAEDFADQAAHDVPERLVGETVT